MKTRYDGDPSTRPDPHGWDRVKEGGPFPYPPYEEVEEAVRNVGKIMRDLAKANKGKFLPPTNLGDVVTTI